MVWNASQTLIVTRFAFQCQPIVVFIKYVQIQYAIDSDVESHKLLAQKNIIICSKEGFHMQKSC